MLALTHGQPATPTTFGKEMGLFAARLASELERIDAVGHQKEEKNMGCIALQIPLAGKFNGAVGNFNAVVTACPNVPWRSVAKAFVESLGLAYQPYSTQIEPHDNLAGRHPGRRAGGGLTAPHLPP